MALTVRVSGVVLGVTETVQPLVATAVDELRSRGKGTPLGRIGGPEDIAKVVRFLLSAAAYITGQGIAGNVDVQ
jgi:3-oxoacyl-[acyl-carrier protein] reductase